MQIRKTTIWALLLVSLIVAPLPAAERWSQWGGEGRDFTVEARKLSSDWAESGPPQIWSKDLGGGFASIVSDGERLYTHYRDGSEEIVVALSRKDGDQIWEHRYAAAVPESEALSVQYGKGPNATPLLADGCVVTFGFTGILSCVNAADGKLRWTHDMTGEFEVRIPYFGHSASPLAVGENVVIVAGGLHAFDLKSGKLAWKNNEFSGNYASPRLLPKGEGAAQIVTPVDGAVAGFDGASGKTLWSVEHKNQWGTILSSPVFDDQGRVFVSASQVGSIMLDPNAKDDAARQLWKSEVTQINHSNAVRRGDWLFASVGESANFLTATSLKDGSRAWKSRGFAQANLIQVGDQYVLLDFDGELALIELNDKGMRINAQATINDAPTWTPPTLLGTTLYMRDESRIAAYDLSPKPASK